MTKAIIKSLGSVCESITYGVTVSANFNISDGPQLLRITDITDTGVHWEKVPRCKISDSDELASLLRDGDIVVARTGGTIGKSFLVTDPPRSVNASYLLRLRPLRDRVLPEYLSQFLGSKTYWSQLTEAARGAAQPNVNATTLSQILLPIPTLAEQHRIATHLKTQLAEVEIARQALLYQLQEVVNLANAYIRESIEQSAAVECSLGDVLDEIKLGIGASWADYPVLGATRDGLAPAKEPPGKQPQRYKPVFSGTVFYNPMRILIGSIAFVDDGDQPGITSPDYVALQGKSGKVDSRWFYYWLRSPYGVQCINSLARGAVRERMLFNRLAEGTIMLPPYQEQLRVSKALAKLKPAQTTIQKQLDDLNKLPQRLLAQAFEGIAN